MSLSVDYARAFRRLRSDASASRWSALTNHRAPHKPLLLLSVLDLCAEGTLTRNLIEISPDLGELFSIYWSKVMPPDRKGELAMPFFHLQSDGFWHLLAQPGKTDILAATPKAPGLAGLRDLIVGARLDDELWTLMQAPDSREVLRAALIEAHFAPEVQPLLLQQSAVNVEAFSYSNALLEQARTQRAEEVARELQDKPAVRDQGFRRAVVTAYVHRCATCGIRIVTADGHTAVDAAHIKPWSISRNDDPRNGMALCRLCHWNFDEGLLSVSPRYVVIVSVQLSANDNAPGHLSTLRDRSIFRPEQEYLWPDTDALKWHNANVFRRR